MQGAVSVSTTLTVSNVTLVSIAISPSNSRVQKGTSLQFTAVGTYSDGSTATLTNVSWRSSKNNLANMRKNGILHAKKAGTLTVSASAFGVTGSTSVTVGTGTLTSIDITPANPTVAHGATQQFVALGAFSDGSTQDVSINSHWSSTIDGELVRECSPLDGLFPRVRVPEGSGLPAFLFSRDSISP